MTSGPALPVHSGPAPVAAHDRVTTDAIGGDAYTISVRGHVLRVDQPTDAGGGDTGPTPTELFVASLAACVATTGCRPMGCG